MPLNTISTFTILSWSAFKIVIKKISDFTFNVLDIQKNYAGRLVPKIAPMVGLMAT